MYITTACFGIDGVSRMSLGSVVELRSVSNAVLTAGVASRMTGVREGTIVENGIGGSLEDAKTVVICARLSRRVLAEWWLRSVRLCVNWVEVVGARS